MRGNVNGLAELKRLQRLTLHSINCSDDLASILPKLRKLSLLNLEGNLGVTGTTVRSIEGLPRLSALSLAATSVKGSDLAGLRKLPLLSLDLMALSLDDNSLRNVEPLLLERLNLKYNFITDRGLERLSKMSTLQLVDVSGNKQVTAGGIAKLSRGGEVEVLVSERESFSLEGD